MPQPQSLTHLLDDLEDAATRDEVMVSEIMAVLGPRSITPFILAVALFLVTPVSGVPGVPTICAIIIVVLRAQALIGQKQPWLPRAVRGRRVPSDRLCQAIGWMRGPCTWIDRVSRRRAVILTEGPMRIVTLGLCGLVPLIFPPLELLPMVTSLGALSIALMTFGLLARDGLFVLLGYGVVAALACALTWLVPG